MFNLEETLKELIEFSHNHHAEIFLGPEISPKTSTLISLTNLINIKTKYNVQYYEISLLDSFICESKFIKETIKYSYEPAKLYAALCLSMLFPTELISTVLNIGKLPQIEWYVKNNTTKDTVEASVSCLYIGSDYSVSSGLTAFAFNNDFKQLLTSKKNGHIILYGFSITKEENFYRLPLSEIELEIQRNSYPLFCKIVPKGIRKLQYNRYDFLVAKSYNLKYYLIGVNDTNA